MCTMIYGDNIKAGQDMLAQQKVVLGDYEMGKDYLNPKNWKFSAKSNGLIMLFLERLCKYSNAVGIEDIEGSVLVSINNKPDLPSIEELKNAYKSIEKICGCLRNELEKDLVKKKLYLFKALIFIMIVWS